MGLEVSVVAPQGAPGRGRVGAITRRGACGALLEPWCRAVATTS